MRINMPSASASPSPSPSAAIHYQPLANDWSSQDRTPPPSLVGPSFKLNFRVFALVTVMLPLIGFVTCVVLSLMLHWTESTATHCGVANLLPSISAAIGSLQPQRYIWRICIALHSTPRLLVGCLYYRRYVNRLIGENDRDNPFNNVIYVNTIVYYLEIVALVGISYISSIENKHVHENCFVVFVCSSLIYMVLSIGLSISIENSNYEHERRSNKAKVYSLFTNVTSIVIALYCYYRHNKYCEPYVYTLFALGEYVFVLSNMGYHMTAYWDFYGYEFNVGPETAATTKTRLV